MLPRLPSPRLPSVPLLNADYMVKTKQTTTKPKLLLFIDAIIVYGQLVMQAVTVLYHCSVGHPAKPAEVGEVQEPNNTQMILNQSPG